MYYLNQSFEEVLSLVITIIVFFFVSVGISFFYLKLNQKTEKFSFRKALLPNFTFFLISFILYIITIYKGINISVFSRNDKTELIVIVVSLLITLFTLTALEILFYKIVFRTKPVNKYCILLLGINLFCYSFIFFSFYPKSYVDRNIFNYTRYLYAPDKKELKLFDNSIVKIDIACSSENCYKNKIKDSEFNFRIPIKQIGTNRMLYSFELLDKSKQIGTSAEDDNCKTISINNLESELKVLFIQRNPNQNLGWTIPLVTDTIVFKKIKTEKRQAGYYGDTNCDCIEQ